MRLPDRAAVVRRLPRWLVEKVPRDHREPDEAFRRRRRVVAGVSLAGAGLLGVSLSTRPDSTAFYLLTLGVAGTWVAGGLRLRAAAPGLDAGARRDAAPPGAHARC